VSSQRYNGPHHSVSRQEGSQRFEELVLEAVEALPERFVERLANVDIEIRDWPSREELRSARVPAGRTLLGLYVGIPHTRRGRRYHMALPDRIFIYRRPIERLCRTDDEVRERVGQVIKHEIAHHFGLTDADLHNTSVS
jgi:predicted Zn-dependent protease with MMP-like domain